MSGLGRVACLAPAPTALIFSVCLAAMPCTAVRGQFGQTSRFKLADSVTLDTPDGAAESHLERVKQYQAVEQWEEAIETLLYVMNHYGDQVFRLYEHSSLTGYTSVRNYCHRQLSLLPPHALTLYRQRVDAQARSWFEEGVAARDVEMLHNVVEQMFLSSWGDDALAALGDLAIEEGDYSRARFFWERLLPATGSSEAPVVRVAYPDSDLDLAGIQARLVWVTILEGSLTRARAQWEQFAQSYPDARGRFGGREVVYAAELSSLLESAENWPVRQSASQWLTFGGNPARNMVMPRANDVGQLAWDPIPLGRLSGAPLAHSGLFSPVRVAEDRNALLSYHPLVAGKVLLVNDQERIMAFDIHTGKPAWGGSASIYPGGAPPKREPARNARRRSRGSLGAARFTMTVFDDRLYARMGNPVTNHAADRFAVRETSELVCLDLSAQGRLVWKITPAGDKWSFEGPPLSDGTNVYVALRRSDVTPQAHVACYDAATGRRRWRRFVCAAQTPGRGLVDETTHNLLTLQRGVIYFNTNLGAVAALEAGDGRIRWISLYARAPGGDLTQPASHFYRDLNPCVYHQGKVLVAPADSEHIFALEATTGRLLWATPPNVDDAVHLLGVAGGKLWASGDRLWWIDVESGKLLGVWPDQSSPKGYGRGVLAGDKVLWPTKRAIHVFDQQTGRRENEHDLRPRTRPGAAGGGNLLIAGGYLLIATSDRLYGFVEFSRLKEQAENEVTARPDEALPQRVAMDAASRIEQLKARYGTGVVETVEALAQDGLEESNHFSQMKQVRSKSPVGNALSAVP